MCASPHCESRVLIHVTCKLVNTWVKKKHFREMSLGKLAATRHGEMAPFMDWVKRSPNRIEFCKTVAIAAKEIATNLIKDADWRRIFDDRSDSRIRLQLLRSPEPLEGLMKTTRTLMNSLEC